MTASILQHLLALYFAIIYSWQLSSSEKTLVRKKFLPYISRVLQIYISFTQIFFFFWEMPVYLVGYAKRMLYSEQPTDLLAWRHLNPMLLTNFENLNSIPNIFQETHNFLVLTDLVIICIYLRTYLFKNLFKGCFPGNSLVCCSPRHSNFFWARHFWNLVGGPAQQSY